MYDNFTVYGPYTDKKQQRRIISLRDKTTGHRTTTSYARYLMTLSLGRELTADEEVDHIDDNCFNDELSNLQILTPEENKAKDRGNRFPNGRAMVELICPQCGNLFVRERRKTHLSKPGQQSPTCCSRSCSGLFQHATGRIPSLL